METCNVCYRKHSNEASIFQKFETAKPMSKCIIDKMEHDNDMYIKKILFGMPRYTNMPYVSKCGL